MDKYEYQVKTEEMLQYMDQKDYRKAMEIADGIDWKHVKNVLMLCKVSEIYEYNRDYQRSREILFFAYDRRPNSRKIVYRLGTLALKLGDTDEAQDCYEEYVNLAPKDPNQYVLRYKIQKAKGVSLDEQIKTLEEFKKVEYIEKWAYELALLYHDAGRNEECLAECDDLILWFSEGKYVYKAMELKQRYKPLTPLQQEKYDQFVAEEEAKKQARNKATAVQAAQALAEEIQEELPAEYRDNPEVEVVDIGSDKNKILSSQVDAKPDHSRDPQVSAFAPIAQAIEAVTQSGAKIVEKIAGIDEEPEREVGEQPEAEETQESPVDTASLAAAADIDSLLASWESGKVEEEPAEAPAEEAAEPEEPAAEEPAETEDFPEIEMIAEDEFEAAPPVVDAEGLTEEEREIEEFEFEEEEAPVEEAEEPEAEEEFGFEEEEAPEEEAEEPEAEEEFEFEEEEAPVEEAEEPEAEEEFFEEAEEESDDEFEDEESDEEEEDFEEEAEEDEESDDEFEDEESDEESDDESEDEDEEEDFEEEAEEDEESDDEFEDEESDEESDDEFEDEEEDFEEEAEEDEEEEDEEPAEPQKVGAKEISLDSFLASLKEDMAREDDEDEFEEEAPEEEDSFEEAEEFDEDDILAQEMAKTKKFSLHGELEEDDFEDEEVLEEATEDLGGRFPDEDDFEEATTDFSEDSFAEEVFAEEDFEEDDFGEDEFAEEDFGEDEFAEATLIEEDFPIEELPKERIPEDEFAEEDPFAEDELDAFSEDDLLEASFDDTDSIEIEDEVEERMNRSEGGVTFDTGFVVQGRYDLETQSEIGLKAGLTQEQKELFSYFVPVQGMSEQIVTVLENDANCTSRYGTSRTGNLLIIGHKGSGKTVLAVDIIKALQKNRNLEKGRVAIIDADKLNHKDLNAIIERLAGGALIIEQAGALSQETIHQLNELMEGQTEEMFVVLEDEKAPLKQTLKHYPEFAAKFTSKLEVPVFINDDLVAFGQTYAKENGFKIDEMGILALYSRIDALQREDHAVTVAEVKEIMDEAIANSRRANVKKLFKRTKDGNNRILLQEQDFKKY